MPPPELRSFLEAYLEGSVTDAQMASFLMAVTLRGMDSDELDALVDVMIGSGEVMKRRSHGRKRIDKHSTGGVGDKVSLILAPLAAELGLQVPMMSGRGLGHTGGTLDKLESIPGFDTGLDLEAFEGVVGSVGTGMIGQTDQIAPLDRRLYALRSETGTVPCIPLIASSIMSKKLSEDLDGLVLDVKVGKGSFLQDLERTHTLARTMVGIGRSRGVPTVAVLSRMEWPLGSLIGNALEVRESMEVLRGEGPSDLIDLTTRLAGEMLRLAGEVGRVEDGVAEARATLASGRALSRFRELVSAQGGDEAVVDDPGLLPTAEVRSPVESKAAGVVTAIDPLALGWGVVELGGGRSAADDLIDHSVGFELAVHVGATVEPETVLGWVHAADDAGAERGRAILEEAITVGPVRSTVPNHPLVVGRVGP